MLPIIPSSPSARPSSGLKIRATPARGALDLVRRDRAAAAAVDADMGHARLREPLHEILEEFHVPALIGRDRNRVRDFFDRRLDDLLDAPVVAEMDDFGALTLQQSPHDIDRGIVTVEERCRRDDANGELVASSTWE